MNEPYSEYKGRPELIRKRDRLVRWKAIGVSVLIFYVVVSLGLLSISAVASFRARQTLIDCTDQQGQCYKQGQTRMQTAVQDMLDTLQARSVVTRKIVEYAVLCTDKPGEQSKHQIEACINAYLKKEGQ